MVTILSLIILARASSIAMRLCVFSCANTSMFGIFSSSCRVRPVCIPLIPDALLSTSSLAYALRALGGRSDPVFIFKMTAQRVFVMPQSSGSADAVGRSTSALWSSHFRRKRQATN